MLQNCAKGEEKADGEANKKRCNVWKVAAYRGDALSGLLCGFLHFDIGLKDFGRKGGLGLPFLRTIHTCLAVIERFETYLLGEFEVGEAIIAGCRIAEGGCSINGMGLIFFLPLGKGYA